MTIEELIETTNKKIESREKTEVEELTHYYKDVLTFLKELQETKEKVNSSDYVKASDVIKRINKLCTDDEPTFYCMGLTGARKIIEEERKLNK